jgi:TonB-dependent receptor
MLKGRNVMKKQVRSPSFVRSASAIAVAACLVSTGNALAQDSPDPTQQEGGEGNEIVVTGVRAALEAAMDIKRDATGVVDAISAEDIGKFPDTNLAESLQRIPGVSIDRRNGEGSQVTVRGFGPAFNLVTVNGRQIATSDVNTVGGDLSVDFGRATSRSFDFSNLAAEGVSRLEVYKTGRAAIPSGGIGASINVVTQRPLDSAGEGLRGSIGAKALYDLSNEDFRVDPEVSGVATWTDPNEMFGISVFGAYQKRESAAASSTVNGWSVQPFSALPRISLSRFRTTAGTTIRNSRVSASMDR